MPNQRWWKANHVRQFDCLTLDVLGTVVSRSRLFRASSLSSSVSVAVGNVPRTVCAVIGARGCRMVAAVVVPEMCGVSMSATLTWRGAPKGVFVPRVLLGWRGTPEQSVTRVCDILSKKRRNQNRDEARRNWKREPSHEAENRKTAPANGSEPNQPTIELK